MLHTCINTRHEPDVMSLLTIHDQLVDIYRPPLHPFEMLRKTTSSCLRRLHPPLQVIFHTAKPLNLSFVCPFIDRRLQGVQMHPSQFILGAFLVLVGMSDGLPTPGKSSRVPRSYIETNPVKQRRQYRNYVERGRIQHRTVI